jgi:hypothetical protein
MRKDVNAVLYQCQLYDAFECSQQTTECMMNVTPVILTLAIHQTYYYQSMIDSFVLYDCLSNISYMFVILYAT